MRYRPDPASARRQAQALSVGQLQCEAEGDDRLRIVEAHREEVFDPGDPRVQRLPAGRPDRPPVQPEQALTPFEALRGYTPSANASIGSLGGRLVPGAPADITVLSVDPLHPDADVVAAAEVLLTTIDGDIVHRAV